MPNATRVVASMCAMLVLSAGAMASAQPSRKATPIMPSPTPDRPAEQASPGAMASPDAAPSISQPEAPAPAADPTTQPPPPARPLQPSGDPVGDFIPGARPDQARGPGISVRLRPRVIHAFDADFNDEQGSYAVSRIGSGLGLSAPINERTRLLFDFDYEFATYEFTDAGDPWEDLHQLSFSPGVLFSIDERWSVIGGGIITSAFEPGADFSETLTYGGYAGTRYAFSDDFALTFGISGKTRLEDSALFLPLLGVEWKINDVLTLATEGPGLKLSAQVRSNFAVVVKGGFELREYRLDDSRDDGARGGVASDDRAFIGAGFEWTPTPNITLGVTGGAVVWQEFEVLNSDGERLTKLDSEPAPFVGVFATISF